MKTSIAKQNIVYWTCYLLLLAAMVAGLCFVEKGEMHLWLNGYHRPWLDSLMRGYTTLAEWPIYIIMVGVPLLTGYKRLFWFYGLSELVQFVLMQILKYSFIAERPILWFTHQSAEMQARFQEVLVEGVTRHELYSFPSGHTGTFFVFFTCSIIFLTGHPFIGKGKRIKEGWLVLAQVVFLALAALGGYSRIYLCQHFLVDVCVGSMIGIMAPLVVYGVNVKRGAWSD